MEDDTAAEDRAVGGVKEEQPDGDTAARSAVNVAATTCRADFVMLEQNELLEKYGSLVFTFPPLLQWHPLSKSAGQTMSRKLIF